MSYQVLARKWRPRNFNEMVGQEHVLRALVNALEQQRLHHAYLFTGTRGVGKTTIARIFAKSLNCEKGVTSMPCGECRSCVEVDEGRFVDLIEVDAASRTRVEDTREILDNVQYAPTRGRYKVYLIDEVHMLSTSSFNALLKTLEEPPPHVKFLLATTDPQKLPVTVLSRCLQFNLKNMTPDLIAGHLKHVMGEEQVKFDDAALWSLARAADGSMRDALSLTDQAIAFGEGVLREDEVRTMLGSVARDRVISLLEHLSAGDAQALLDAAQELASHAADFSNVLEEMLQLLHRIAVLQAVPAMAEGLMDDELRIKQLASQMLAEEAQLFYQIALTGRRDLPLNPDPRSGFEMLLLRMLAFRPDDQSAATMPPAGQAPQTIQTATHAPASPPATGGFQAATHQVAPVQPAAVAQPAQIAGTEKGRGASNHLAQLKASLGGNAPGVMPAGKPAREVVNQPVQTGPVVTTANASAQPATSLIPQAQASQAELDPAPQLQAQTNDPALAIIASPFASPLLPASNPALDPAANSAPTVSAPSTQQYAAPTPVQNVQAVPPQKPQSFTQPPVASPASQMIHEPAGEFVAENAVAEPVRQSDAAPQSQSAPDSMPAVETAVPVAMKAMQPANQQAAPPQQIAQQPLPPISVDSEWWQILQHAGAKGITGTIGTNSLLVDRQPGVWKLLLEPDCGSLLTQQRVQALEHALSTAVAQSIRLDIEVSNQSLAAMGETPQARLVRLKQERQAAAEQSLREDPAVQKLIETFGAFLIPASIEPFTPTPASPQHH
ncbi:DNA polymerase III subunit gamma/tau [Pelagibaculum spongiae]|uniref:DNA polymerase III subunit gamma/tau n=1 Tax=Pelagibaculum spongiae TaxID=2080658 RepID=A0A2V1GPT9_9GAMM|nr:DNA polymerase III subunit gamma/tau [Pelagibaculum spongiae]PVZ64979.1 DNA polymerase III subunit gamma/tau [Pelagibaculum spongiae]